MFGLTELEMERYRDLAQDFAIRDVAPDIVKKSQFIIPAYVQGEKIVPDTAYLNQLKTDIETIATLTTTNMAMEYAHLQVDSGLTEKEIAEKLHATYQDYVLMQFLKYGVSFTIEVLTKLTEAILLEMPYLYSYALDSADFDEDKFLEERLEAYTQYIGSMLDEDEDDEDYEDEYEDEDFEEEEELDE